VKHFFTQVLTVILALGSALLLVLATACNAQEKAAPGAGNPDSTASSTSAVSEVTKDTKNPLSDLAKAVAEGKTHYQVHCALCHGDQGKGDGPAGSAYETKAIDLTQGQAPAASDGELFLTIKKGKGKMPPAKKMSDEQIWQAVAYLRTLAGKK
jgi:mono/diheme cytochrome c family protein